MLSKRIQHTATIASLSKNSCNLQNISCFYASNKKVFKKTIKKFCQFKNLTYLCNAIGKRAFSSAGSEHLPYKQRVGGSNPSTPTKLICYADCAFFRAFSSAGSEHLPYKQRVGGSNPSTPTRYSLDF